MSDARVRRLDWGRRALEAYVSSLVHIAGENRQAALLVEGRVDRALSSILAHPRIGTPGLRRNERICPPLELSRPRGFKRGPGLQSLALKRLASLLTNQSIKNVFLSENYGLSSQ